MSAYRLLYKAGWWVPFAAIFALLGIYFAHPTFYKRYILEEQMREYQIVEIITVASSLLAGVLLVAAAARLWSRRVPVDPDAPGLTNLAARHGPWGIAAVAGAAALFLAGEEVSWGQTFTHWGVPEIETPVTDTNLHNQDGLPINQLGSVYLALQYFALPLAWLMRDRLPLPRTWASVIPEAPVVCILAVATVWKLKKSAYRDIYGHFVPDAENAAFYAGFMGQMNEQKEMLVALGILWYAMLRHAALNRDR